MIDLNAAKQFLKFFLRGSDDPRMHLFFVHKSIKGMLRTTSFLKSEMDAGLQEAAELNKNGFHVYFCSALRKPSFESSTSYGGKKDVGLVNGYHVDVDFRSAQGAHASDNLPTEDEALAVFEALELAPSYVVNSGNGFQLHFLFDKPLPVGETNTIRVIERAALAFAKPIQKAFESKGWECDAAKTATIQRVWRLPGFQNLKTDPPNPCFIYKAAASDRITFLPPTAQQNSNSPQSHSVKNYSALKRTLLERSSKDLPKMWKLVYAGKALPDAPGHNNLTQRLASSIAWADRGQTQPEALADILRPSLQHWANQPNASMDIDERLEEVTNQIAKAQVEYLEQREEEAQEEHALLAAALGDRAPAVDEKFLICRSGTRNFYMFDFKRKEYCRYEQQGYDGAYAFIKSNWTRENGCPIKHTKFLQGQVVEKSPRDYIHSNSVQVNVMKKSFIGNTSRVRGDERGVNLILPAGVRRPLEPQESPEVHEWLMALAGEDPALQRLFTLWLAALYRQEKRACLLYISGPKLCGKSTFVQGVARQWRAAPADLVQVFQRFNGDCENTPIWWADEKAEMPRGVDIAAKIRRLITLRDHKIEKKGHEIYETEGYGRLIVTANDMKALASPYNSQQSEDGKEATAERILYLQASPRAIELMAKYSAIGDVEEDWVRSNKIAQHVLFLQDKHEEEVTNYPHRMVGSVPVEQDVYKYEKFKLLAPSSQFDSDITIWFATMLERMQDKHQVDTYKELIVIKDGVLYLKPVAVGISWEKWDDTKSQGNAPKLTAVSSFLKNVTEDNEVRLKVGNKRLRFKKLIPKRLLQHLDATFFSEEAALEHFADLGIDISTGEE